MSPPSPPALGPTYLLVYTGQDDCEGQPYYNVSLDNNAVREAGLQGTLSQDWRSYTLKGCQDCWDRCAPRPKDDTNPTGVGPGVPTPTSYRIMGPGSVAIAWNCIGAWAGYTSAMFHRGGYARTESSGCLRSQGGGAFVLCHSASFLGDHVAAYESDFQNMSFSIFDLASRSS